MSLTQNSSPEHGSALGGASRLYLTLFYSLSSLAEGGQGVVVLWLTYALTENPVLVGFMVVLGYLPASILGLVFVRFAAKGRAELVVRGTNTVLSLVSLALGCVYVFFGDVSGVMIAALATAQVVLSLAKMFNKSALSRLVRSLFAPVTAKRFLSQAQSASLIGQVLGTGVAGVVLSYGWVTGALMGAAGSYLLAACVLTLGTRQRIATTTDDQENGERTPVAVTPAESHRLIRWNPGLVAILVFSVPSSGALQFINAALVLIAAAVAPNEPSYYALLNIVVTVGGFLAGVLLSTQAVPARWVLGWGLPLTSVLTLGLAMTDFKYVVVVAGFLFSLVVTCHIIYMQVLTNQVPREEEVGPFAVVRNVVASLAKALFAFGAGTLVGSFGVVTAIVVLAASTALFGVLWPLARQRWHTFDTATL